MNCTGAALGCGTSRKAACSHRVTAMTLSDVKCLLLSCDTQKGSWLLKLQAALFAVQVEQAGKESATELYKQKDVKERSPLSGR
jgi:hypothetical protein